MRLWNTYKLRSRYSFCVRNETVGISEGARQNPFQVKNTHKYFALRPVFVVIENEYRYTATFNKTNPQRPLPFTELLKGEPMIVSKVDQALPELQGRFSEITQCLTHYCALGFHPYSRSIAKYPRSRNKSHGESSLLVSKGIHSVECLRTSLSKVRVAEAA